MTIYVGDTKPFKVQLFNRIELFNEFMIQCCTVHVILFTDFCSYLDARDTAGYSMVYHTALLVTVNLIFIIKTGGRGISLVAVLNKDKIKLRCAKINQKPAVIEFKQKYIEDPKQYISDKASEMHTKIKLRFGDPKTEEALPPVQVEANIQPLQQ